MAIGLFFSGQGAQAVGMGKSLYEHSPIARALFDEANAVLGFDLKQACFEGPDTLLTQTRVCQPALYVHGYALFKILESVGRLTDLKVASGLSLGELTALAAAGVWDFATGLKVVAERGRLMQAACESSQGGMASLIGGDLAGVEGLCKEFDLDISNYNSPGQTVISGDKERIALAVEAAKGRGFKMAVPLNVAGAYHSRLMEPARVKFEAFLKDIPFNSPKIAVFTNTTGKQVEQPDAIREALVKQVVSAVRWVECVEGVSDLGVSEVYECGPGGVLAGLTRRIDKALTVKSLSEWGDLGLEAVPES
ncbi:MAG TPA: ACP S-malonyltransferase [Opitutales bacterium]|nr:ACP S-malonyltransferase [Opitutales bacterium]